MHAARLSGATCTAPAEVLRIEQRRGGHVLVNLHPLKRVQVCANATGISAGPKRAGAFYPIMQNYFPPLVRAQGGQDCVSLRPPPARARRFDLP